MKASKKPHMPAKRAMGGKMDMAMDDMSMPMPPMKPKVRKPSIAMAPAPKPMPPLDGEMAKPRLDRMRRTQA